MAKNKTRSAMENFENSLALDAAEQAQVVELDHESIARDREIQAKRAAAAKELTVVQQELDATKQDLNATKDELAAAKFVLDQFPIALIQDRRDGNTRELLPEQVVSLAGSIAEIGLINPISVEMVVPPTDPDSDPVPYLLAGGHRCAALRLLALEPSQRSAFIHALKTGSHKSYSKEVLSDLISTANALPVKDDLVPVRKFVWEETKDKNESTIRSLKVEVAENEKRRNYTAAEILSVADKLKALGYAVFQGRPRKDEDRKNLIPTLCNVLGLHATSVHKAFREREEAEVRAKSGEVAVTLTAKKRTKPVTLTAADVLQFVESTNSKTDLTSFVEAAKKRLKELDKREKPQS